MPSTSIITSARIISLCTLFFLTFTASAQHYKNFRVAVYSRAYETREMGKREYIEPIWNELTSQLKVDKIYLETHRDLIIVDQPHSTPPNNFSKAAACKWPAASPTP